MARGGFRFYCMDGFSYTVNMCDLLNKLLILRTPRVGPARYNDLMARFGDASAVVASMNIDAAHRDAVCREMDMAAANGVHYICDTDDLYPAGLRAIKNHPPVITARGNLNALRRVAVAMVGTRHASACGMSFTADLANAFASHGVAVVSGMAMGTDTAAHRGALRGAGDAVTIAVLAGGADYVWPTENESLYREILARGVVVSEMPVGFVPQPTNFVQRNRIIAGICNKLILGEADLKSGSMTTARFAIEYGREVWAVPSHPSDGRAAGPNSLISAGLARLCNGPADFFGNRAQSPRQNKNAEKMTTENILLDKLGAIPVSESVLAQLVQKNVSEIKRDLVVLELQGLVRKVDGGYIRL